MITVRIEPTGPIIARDGRPFNADGGNRMHSNDWPFPSTVAGTLRTLLGKLPVENGMNPFSDPQLIEKLKLVELTGPFPMQNSNNIIYLPAPRDVLFYENQQEVHAMVLRPKRMAKGEGCDLPHKDLWPMEITADVKPLSAPAFWSTEKMCEWLSRDPAPVDIRTGTLGAFEKDSRVHVMIDPKRGSAQDEKLFITEGIALQEGVSIIASLRGGMADQLLALSPDKLSDKFLHPFGGERRLSAFSFDSSYEWGPTPQLCAAALDGHVGLRMVLATPGIFKGGWLPGWLDQDTLAGEPPCAAGLRLRLRGAVVDRWRAVSGWDMQLGKEKPVRRVAPAGSVYFFEVLSGNPGEFVVGSWLRSVSDELQDRRDGFGAALWGVWQFGQNH